MNEPRFVPEIWSNEILRHLNAFGPNNSTPEQKQASSEKFQQYLAKSAALHVEIVAKHEALIESASDQLRPILELHAPRFRNDTDSDPDCGGCDLNGYEPDPPVFPCTTYDLAASLVTS